ncbi:MAG: hypothetical protein JKX85_06345, partial [Phycisphaeraceae bacterium]|nr:hypothetical protein [Phycisphaeraceae bacterium]
MVTEYGMSEKLGFQFVGEDEQRQSWQSADSLSNETAKIIDDEIKLLIDTTYAQATKIIEDHRDQLDAIAQALLKYETLSSEEVKRLMDGEELDKPTISDLLATEQDKLKQEQPPESSEPSDTSAPRSSESSDSPDSPDTPDTSDSSENRPNSA